MTTSQTEELLETIHPETAKCPFCLLVFDKEFRDYDAVKWLGACTKCMNEDDYQFFCYLETK